MEPYCFGVEMCGLLCDQRCSQKAKRIGGVIAVVPFQTNGRQQTDQVGNQWEAPAVADKGVRDAYSSVQDCFSILC
eukprot:15020-Heterococcus_DN1.PRE.2